MKKKITVIFCVIFIIFNFIYSSIRITRAENLEDIQNSLKFETNGDSSDFLEKMKKRKITVKSNGEEHEAPTIVNNDSAQSVSAIFTRFLTFIVEWANNIPELAVEATDANIDIKYFTIYSLVMGEYDFFNMNFFDTSGETEKANVIDVIKDNTVEDSNISDAIIGNAKRVSLGGKIKQQIRTFYYIFRALGIGISLFVLIYIGIRIAISSVASDKSKYKKMLIDWIASIFLLMFMHIIIVIFSYLSGEALNLVKRLADLMGVTNIEEGILSGNLSQMGNSTGFHLISSFITIAIFVYYELKFFIAYVIRFCEISILVVVAPLVTITYSIDKVADSKAQAFTAWFKELSIKYSIQVVHALTYCVFIASAGVIATEAPIFAAVFLLALDKAEKIFRNLLNVKDNGFEKAKVPILDNN